MEQYTEKSIPNLSERLVPHYFDNANYLSTKEKFYCEKYTGILPRPVIRKPITTVRGMVLHAIYMRNHIRKGEEINTLINQLSIIQLLQALPTYSLEEITKILESARINRNSYLAVYEDDFEDIYYFLKAGVLYDNDDKVTARLDRLLRFVRKPFLDYIPEGQLPSYLNYLSEMAQCFIDDAIGHFLEHFDIFYHDYQHLLEGIIDTRTSEDYLPVADVTDVRTIPMAGGILKYPKSGVSAKAITPSVGTLPKRVRFDFLKTPGGGADKENGLNKHVVIDEEEAKSSGPSSHTTPFQ